MPSARFPPRGPDGPDVPLTNALANTHSLPRPKFKNIIQLHAGLVAEMAFEQHPGSPLIPDRAGRVARRRSHELPYMKGLLPGAA